MTNYKAPQHVHKVCPVHAMNAEQCQTAADPWTKPTHLSHWPACRQLWNYIHHRHLLLLSPEADTHFTIPQRVEGWVDPRWLVIYPSRYATATKEVNSAFYPLWDGKNEYWLWWWLVVQYNCVVNEHELFN